MLIPSTACVFGTFRFPFGTLLANVVASVAYAMLYARCLTLDVAHIACLDKASLDVNAGYVNVFIYLTNMLGVSVFVKHLGMLLWSVGVLRTM